MTARTHVICPQLLETKITGIIGADGRDVWTTAVKAGQTPPPRAPVPLDRTRSLGEAHKGTLSEGRRHNAARVQMLPPRCPSQCP